MATTTTASYCFIGTGFSNSFGPAPIHLAEITPSSISIIHTFSSPSSNPSCIVSHPTSPILYIVDETRFGTVQAITYSNPTLSSPTSPPTLTPLAPPISSTGRVPCHISLSSAGAGAGFLLVSNYIEGSVAVLPLTPRLSLSPATDSKAHQYCAKDGYASLQDRQEHSHAHCAVVSPNGNFALVADLGLSKVFSYDFDSSRGSLQGSFDSSRHLQLRRDCGARHLAFSKYGDFVYVTCEMTSTLAIASFDEGTGNLEVSASFASEAASIASRA